MGPLQIVSSILSPSLITLRRDAESRGSIASARLTSLIEDLPLELEAAGRGAGREDDILQWLRAHARQLGLDQWLNNTYDKIVPSA